MPLAPGVRFGPYEIVALIGVGGMGEVYKAHDTKLGRDVAIKIVSASGLGLRDFGPGPLSEGQMALFGAGQRPRRERSGARRRDPAYEPGRTSNVVWSPDGSRLAFANDQSGARDFYVKPTSGASPQESLFRSSAVFKDPSSWSADGRFIVFSRLDPRINRDLGCCRWKAIASRGPT